MFWRIIMFFLTLTTFLFGWYGIGLVLVIIASLRTTAYEYPFMAVCIDCYFGPVPLTFWYTAFVTSIVIAGLWLQPYLWYKTYET